MLNTQRATRGMVVAPHALAAQAGQAVLREGGNAIEATVTATGGGMTRTRELTLLVTH